MSDDNKPPADPTADPTTADKPVRARQAKTKVGDVLKVGDGYALVVGFENVTHQHEDSNGEKTERKVREHPLIIDLPAPRRYELETTPAS